jgi:DNA-directed RNA polymerase subunit RPC12/RpoP
MKGKCAQCGKLAKLYYMSFDPDIKQVHRCKKCTDQVVFKTMMAVYLPVEGKEGNEGIKEDNR